MFEFIEQQWVQTDSLCLADNNNFDYFSYSNEMFKMADSLSARQVERYYTHQQTSRSDMDRFLAKGCRLDTALWADIIGTHYIREQKYQKAIHWLSMLPEGNEKWMNVSVYMENDPFDLAIDGSRGNRKRVKSTNKYKLIFAQRMATYERQMRTGKDKNERAKAKLMYAVGWHNSWDFNWALTRYKDTAPWWIDEEDKLSMRIEDEKKHSRRMIDAALKEMDREMRGKFLHALERNRQVMDECDGTSTARYLRLHCDTWRDYHPKGS